MTEQNVAVHQVTVDVRDDLSVHWKIVPRVPGGGPGVELLRRVFQPGASLAIERNWLPCFEEELDALADLLRDAGYGKRS